MWSDPEEIAGWAISPRGAGYLFGASVAQEVRTIHTEQYTLSTKHVPLHLDTNCPLVVVDGKRLCPAVVYPRIKATVLLAFCFATVEVSSVAQVLFRDRPIF